MPARSWNVAFQPIRCSLSQQGLSSSLLITPLSSVATPMCKRLFKQGLDRTKRFIWWGTLTILA